LPLELATRLILRDSQDGSPLPAERLRTVIANWAGVPEAAVDEVRDVAGRSGGVVTTQEARLDGRRRWDLVYARPDDGDPTVQWRVEVSSLFDADRTSFVARLRRESIDHRLRPLTGSPKPPRVIREVLGTDGVDCFDGPTRVEPRYRELRGDEVAGFVDTQLSADDRRLPVVGVSKAPPRAPGRLDVTRLTAELAGFAHVILLDRAALPHLGRALGSLSVAPGHARLWWPGLQLDDDSSVHPYWLGPFEDPAATVESIRRLVLTVSRDRWREPERLVAFERELRRHRDELGRAAARRLAADFEALRGAAAEDRARADAAAAEAESAPVVDIDAYERRLGKVAGDLDAVNEQLERQRVAAEAAAQDWIESEEQRERAEQENRSLRGQLAGLRAQLSERGAASSSERSPEQRFEDDVRASWEQRMTVDDRASHPLAPFVLRAEFVESIAKATADRQKVVDTVAEVACNRAKEIEGRRLHKLRSGSGGDSPERKRGSDSAVAWRCNVQTNSASARRLHFWACPGGSLEFVSVVTHDDFGIAE